MGGPLADLANGYRVQYGEAVSSPVKLQELYADYVHVREATLIDAVASTLALNDFFFADEIDLGSVTDQMGEAFARAFPNKDLAQRLEELRELAPDSREVTGFMSSWKGVYHEVLVRDRLNDGHRVGSVVLEEGQHAVLPPKLNEPGLDIRIFNSDGTEALVLQAKATNEIGLVSKALEKYPDIQVAATNEVAADALDQRVFPSGFDNEALRNRVEQPMVEVWDGPIEEFIEQVLPLLPFVIITTMEGTRVLLGKQSFQMALHRATQRGVKSVAAIGVGALMSLMGVGVFSLPAALFTSLGIDRFRFLTQLVRKLEGDRVQLLGIVR
jgi:hypothetical protein